MKIVRFAIDNKVRYGILKGESIQAIEDKPYRGIKPSDCYYQLSEVKLLPPCTPSKIVAIGLNYHSHAKEVNARVPNAPLIFLKPSTALIGPGDNIVYPSTSHKVDYEGELGVVIKKPVWKVSVEDALDYVLGYTCFNDVTARDLQYHDKQWTRAKSFNTFAAAGPCIETELDPGNFVVETYLSGELKQKGNTSDLIYSVPELIDFISHVMTLLPGDIIATGTPSGIGPMYPGDTVEIKIETIGTLRNYVVGDSK
ncbi:MAG TPA: fumarylacetoacetate hydrolase family protein [Dehalococcoidia bacterium]|jgi:2-keto-4-pentenoate hydratase/2-oxohepta-3-ene-1,7-dioic acid hydratase in catechol pathway|nr:fumarylacetoacetate hydrolase family protein [Dehalococcoidia bacterium]